MGDEILRLQNGTKVFLQHSARAKRIILRVGRTDGRAVMVIPKGVSLNQARDFAISRQEWLAAHQAAAPGRLSAVEGATLPVAGKGLLVTRGEGRAAARIEGGRIIVPQGRPVGPVIAAYLKQEARPALLRACEGYVAKLAEATTGTVRPFTSLVLRDTRTRWGSCTTAGRLMFSWRLAMAPPHILEYVAAHEVAHLRHMDHSEAFWSVVGILHPGYREARLWLRRNGPQLQAWNFASDAAQPRIDG